MKADANGVMAVTDRFDRRMRLARASELALFGRLLEAETIIVSERRFPNSWEELDLLARIRVREGKYADALKLWHRVFSLSPHLSSAQACIESLKAYAEIEFKRQRQTFMLLWAVWSAAVIAGVAVVVWRLWR